MTNKKITELTENTTPLLTDVIEIVDDPGGSALSQKITLANLKTLINSLATDAVWDAAGDLVQGTGANTAARLPIGTANQLPRVNSGATAVEWAGVGRVLISEQTPTGTGTVTWNNIPATYKTLEIEFVIRTLRVANTAIVYLYFNNDTTAANYRSTQTGSAGTASDSPYLALMPGTTSLADTAGVGYVKIFDYTPTVFFKDARAITHYRLAAGTVAHFQSSINWENTAAITRIDIVTESGNYDAGTTFRLYGVY